MAKNRDSILDRAREQGLATPSAGMSVPEGYFDAFASGLIAKLPEQPEMEREQAVRVPRTWWERLRPYAYMAAMFAGIWLMLQMFVSFDRTNTQMNVEDNPVLAEALAGDDFIFDYVCPALDSDDLVDDWIESEDLDKSFQVEDLFGEESDLSESSYILP